MNSQKDINVATYNNCFTLGGKIKKKGKLIKVPVCVEDNGNGQSFVLDGGKKKELRPYYELSYDQTKQTFDTFMQRPNLTKQQLTARISLYLDNAMFGDLHIFVIDFDKFDEESTLFIAAKALADKITRSQGGGYHMFYGVNKEAATPLFDSVNLLASKRAASYISHTGAISLDGKNKVDFFCDAHRLIYEWEEWDNTVGLTDKTQELYELIKEHFELRRPMNSGKYTETGTETPHVHTAKNTRKTNDWQGENHRYILLEDLPEDLLRQQMGKRQQLVFDDLKNNYSSDCPANEWFRIGIDIYRVFGDELGGSVFLWWSKPGHSYSPQGCERTWNNICSLGSNAELRNNDWLFAINAFYSDEDF